MFCIVRSVDTATLRIGELSKRSGVSPDLLRAWERRYGLLQPTRSPGGLRLYSLGDLERVRLMQDHLAGGLAAAEAAALASRVEHHEPARRPVLPAGSSLRDLAQALDDFDEPRAQAVLDGLLALATVDALLTEVVLPYLRELGERWERGEASIAQEHFASAVLRGRLLGLARGWGRGLGPLALLACLPGEQHDLGLIAFGLALRARGWRIAYLGSDTPLETLDATARSPRAGARRRDRRGRRARAGRRSGAARAGRAPSRRPSAAAARTRTPPRSSAPSSSAATRSPPPTGSRRSSRPRPGAPVRPALDGWRSVERRHADGAVDSEQRVLIARPAVEPTPEGARRLGCRYWLEVQRASHGLVRSHESDGHVELLLLACPPALLTFRDTQVTVDGGRVRCSYRIAGGLLARRPGGTVSLGQSSGEQAELSVAVEGFFPRLGLLHGLLQRRFHVLVSRRFFRRLLAEAPQ